MRNSLKIDATSSIGFLVGIGAWSLSFITLIWGYLFYRLRAGVWLADYISQPIFTRALINTGVLLISSWLLRQFFQKRIVPLLIAGLLTGVLFLKLQWDLWLQLVGEGLTLTNSIAGSFLYLLTGFHALHIFIGTLILLPLGVTMFRLAENKRTISRFSFALNFWDLLLVFWFVLFVLIFIFK